MKFPTSDICPGIGIRQSGFGGGAIHAVSDQ